MVAEVARSRDRNRALREIAVLLARDGQVLRAFALLDAINDPIDLMPALFDLLWSPDSDDYVFVVPTGAKERSAALKAVQRVVALSRSLDDPERRGQAMFEASSLYLEFGEIDAATALMDQSEGDGWQPLWLNKRVHKLVETGDFAEAERLAEAIAESDPEWIWSYWTLAEGLAAAGQPAEARRVLGRLANPSSRLLVQTQVAVDLADIDPKASARFLAEAEALTAGIADPDDRVQALGWVGAAFAEIGDSDTAQAVAARLITVGAAADATSAALTGIASALGETGQGTLASLMLDAAEGQAILIGDAKDRASALQSVAWNRTERSQYAEAERVAMGIDDEFYRGIALQDLGVALAESGAAAEAQRIAAVLRGPAGSDFQQKDGPYEIAKTLAGEGEVAAAEAVAESIVEPDWRAQALAEVAEALAGSHPSDAERIGRRVEDAGWRSVVLAAVAAGL